LHWTINTGFSCHLRGDQWRELRIFSVRYWTQQPELADVQVTNR
jgi:hypothetical protein